MNHALRLSLVVATATLVSLPLAGCGYDQRTSNGYYTARPDRGTNIDSDSPGIPERTTFTEGDNPATEDSTGNTPVPAALREPASPTPVPFLTRTPPGTAGETPGPSPATQPSR